MQNDAKLGLLAGVVGVIIAAIISGKTPSPSGTAAGPPIGTTPQSAPNVKAQLKANNSPAPAALKAE
jgi:hypothetical protein